MSEGHVFLPKEILEKRTVDLLGVSQEAVEKHIMDLAVDRKLVAKETGGRVCVYGAQAYYVELNTAKMLHDLNISCEISESAVLTKVAAIEKRTGTILDEMQKEAVVQAAGHALWSLPEDRVPGKTTTINTLNFLFRAPRVWSG